MAGCTAQHKALVLVGRHLFRCSRRCPAVGGDLQRDQRVAIVVDTGVDYFELCGVEILGSVEFVGEQPRVR